LSTDKLYECSYNDTKNNDNRVPINIVEIKYRNNNRIKKKWSFKNRHMSLMTVIRPNINKSETIFFLFLFIEKRNSYTTDIFEHSTRDRREKTEKPFRPHWPTQIVRFYRKFRTWFTAAVVYNIGLDERDGKAVFVRRVIHW